MNIRCPHCQTLFRVDPARVPAHGIRARCAKCGGTFQIPGSAAAGAAPAARPPAESGSGSGSVLAGPGPGAAPPSPDSEPTYPPAPPAAPAPPVEPPEARQKPAPMPPPPEVFAPEVPAEAAPAPPQAPAGAGADVPGAGPLPPSASASDAGRPTPATRPVFGSRDPQARALRIARALVSDIVAYHPDRRAKALAAGTLRVEFKEEIMKSWEEYVAQVGQELAKSTPYFRQSLNEILAQGQNVF